MTWRVELGDCRELLAALPEGSVDACVTDPPYSLGFMGKQWDRHDDADDPSFASWLAGFIDGEGCFVVKRHARGSFGCSMAIKLRRDDRAILERIARFVGYGSVVDVAGSGNGKPCVRYAVQCKAGCMRLVDLLSRHPLRAKKLRDFVSWAEAVCAWHNLPRGNRWHGARDYTRLEHLRAAVMSAREYRDPPWSGDAFQDWTREWAEGAFRALKPGAHLVAFGGTRTSHRLVAGIEDAGFEIRDSLAWLFGSGFPKSLNLGDGWGTALKPAHEPICLARKPLDSTVAACVEKHGTGALNVDGCRVAGGARPLRDATARTTPSQFGAMGGSVAVGETTAGRWPPNVLLDDEAAAMLDEQSGESTSTGGQASLGAFRGGRVYGAGRDERRSTDPGLGDTGGASRFFPRFRYEPKASTAEREFGCEGLNEADFCQGYAGNPDASPDRDGDIGLNRIKRRRNTHPTVKPADLMRWLVRLVTPPGGLVLDPFTGSGTTGIAAVMERASFVGFELGADHIEIARRRIEAATQVAPRKLGKGLPVAEQDDPRQRRLF